MLKIKRKYIYVQIINKDAIIRSNLYFVKLEKYITTEIEIAETNICRIGEFNSINSSPVYNYSDALSRVTVTGYFKIPKNP